MGNTRVQIGIPQISGTARINGNARLLRNRQLFTLLQQALRRTGVSDVGRQLDLGSDFDISFNFLDPSTADQMVRRLSYKAIRTVLMPSAAVVSGIENELAIVFNAKLDITRLTDTDAGSQLKALTPAVSLGNLENKHQGTTTSSGTPETHTLQYWVDGKLSCFSGNLAAKYFGGWDHIHFGFTGATGTVGDIEQIRVTQLSVGELEYGTLTACDCTPFIDTDEHSHVTYAGSASIDAANLIALTPSVPFGGWIRVRITLSIFSSDFSLSFIFKPATRTLQAADYPLSFRTTFWEVMPLVAAVLLLEQGASATGSDLRFHGPGCRSHQLLRRRAGPGSAFLRPNHTR